MPTKITCPTCGHDQFDEDGDCLKCFEPSVRSRAEPRTMLDHALDLARRGFAVFPLKRKSKLPACKHGCKDGTTDPDRIEKLFARKRDPNIGISTGSPSGIWVIDADGSEGVASFAWLSEKRGGVPTTVSVRTGGGGQQLYFRLNGEPIRNRQKLHGEPIDVRGEGGYVVAVPSIHPDTGNRYEWINDPDSTRIADAPDWLVEWVLGDQEPVWDGLEFTIGEDLDLDADPGASKGERHTRLLTLLGVEIARGRDLAEVWDQANKWAARCTPKLEESEVKRLLDYVVRQRAVKVEDDRREVEAEPLPDSIPWPEVHEDALQGLAGEIVQAIGPETEADPVALLAQLLAGFGNLIGRGSHYVVEGSRHYANLFTVLVGTTSRGRKGTSEARVRELLRFVDEDWATNRILTGLVSGEGLVWNVRDPIYKTEPIKQKGKVVGYQEVLADPGVEDKRLLIVEPEFASVLRVCKRESNTLSPTIRSAWDTGTLRTMAKNSPARSTGAHVSIVGHITEAELKRSLAEVEMFSGFSNRILWLLVRRSKLLPEGGRDLDLSPFAQRLKYCEEFARSVGRMYRDDQAAKLWREVYFEINERESGGLVGAVTSRAEAQTLRLSLIYALLDRSFEIQAKHLRAAYAVWRYAEQSARRIFGSSTGDSLADRVLAEVRKHQETGVGRWELHQAIGKDHKAKVLVEILAQLRDAGLIVRDTVATTGGRPAEVWFPATTPRKGPEETEEKEVSPSTEAEGRSPVEGDTSDTSVTSCSDWEETTI